VASTPAGAGPVAALVGHVFPGGGVGGLEGHAALDSMVAEAVAAGSGYGGVMVGPTGGARGGVGRGGVGTLDPAGLAADAEATGSGEGGGVAGLELAPDLIGTSGVGRGEKEGEG